MNIASYYAKIGFQVNTQDIRKVDRALSLVENKMKAFQNRLSKTFSLKLDKFDVDQRRLNMALGNALDVASTRTVFQVARFNVDQANLNRVMTQALGQASRVASSAAVVRPGVSPTRAASTRSGVRTSAGLGGIGLGLMGPLGYGALALAGGGYGLGALNKRNQEVVAAQLQSQAVTQAFGGTAEQGQANFEYLRNLGNKVGFNYLQASGDFNNLMSNILGAGGTQQQGRNIFKGFSEYGRVNKLSAARMNLVFNALSQVAGKDKLQAEELTKQLGNSLPGAKDIFAQAYQQQLKAQGKGSGNLTGSEAIIALEAAMKKGQVRGDILNYAAAIASTRAAPGLEKASMASAAEQAKYQNTVTDLAVVASNAGVEEGFARIFRTLNAGLSESNGLVEGLASGFNEATKWADDLILFPQSFIRALEGKDSVVADWLGVESTKQLVQDFKDLKDIWTQITSIKAEDIFGDFLPNLQSTSRELAAIINFIAQGKEILSGNLPTQKVDYASVEQIDPFGTGAYPSPLGLAKAGINNFLVGLNEYGDRKERMSAINDPNSIYYNDPVGYDAMQKDRAMASQEDAVRNAMITNQIQIQLNVDAVTLSQMNIEAQADLLTQRLAIGLEQVMVNFPQKE